MELDSNDSESAANMVNNLLLINLCIFELSE